MGSKALNLSNMASAILVAVVVAVHWMLSHLAVRFRELFAGFGFDTDTQLPVLTQVMLSENAVFWLVPGFVALLIALNRVLVVQKSAVIGVSALATLVTVVVFGVAMYLPVRHLGAIVQ